MPDAGKGEGDMKNAWNHRWIDDEFVGDLTDNEGILNPLLKVIQKDKSVSLELRHKRLALYYRGGKLLELGPRTRKGYTRKFDAKYFNTEFGHVLKTEHRELFADKKVENSDNARRLCFQLLVAKYAMDLWFGSKKEWAEREFAQVLVRENNFGRLGAKSDYVICDFEYSNSLLWKEPRTILDLVGACFREVSGNIKGSRILTLFEMKYGEGALEGQSGLIGHIDKVKRFLGSPKNIEELKTEMASILGQKRQLGLFNADVLPKEFAFTNDSPEYMLILANIRPGSPKLAFAVQELEKQERSFPLPIRIGVATYAGYGLFHGNIYDLREFRRSFLR